MNPAVVLPFAAYHSRKSVSRTRHGDPIPHEAVRIQLSKILKSDGFVRAERMRRFLQFIVEETLAGRANQVCEYSIGLSVFGRDESFEPGLDPIVRNDARRLRQKLLEYYQRSRLKCVDDQVLIDVPKGTYIPVFSVSSHASAPKANRRYRLTIRLTRIDDNAEIWATEHEFDESGPEIVKARRVRSACDMIHSRLRQHGYL